MIKPDFGKKIPPQGVHILGKKGSKIEFFRSFSKSSLMIWFVFRLKLIWYYICVLRLRSSKILGLEIWGQTGSKLGTIDSLKMHLTDFADSLAGGGYYGNKT